MMKKIIAKTVDLALAYLVILVAAAGLGFAVNVFLTFAGF